MVKNTSIYILYFFFNTYFVLSCCFTYFWIFTLENIDYGLLCGRWNTFSSLDLFEHNFWCFFVLLYFLSCIKILLFIIFTLVSSSPRAAGEACWLWWDGSGLCLFAKRLDEDKFRWPKVENGVIRLAAPQLMALVEGMDWTRVRAERRRRPTSAG